MTTPIGDFYRYEIQVDGVTVYRGIAVDLEAARRDTRHAFPTGLFVQVGDRTTVSVVQAWLQQTDER